MPIERLRPSFSITEDRLRDLQAIIPEAFLDGKINWESLREALGSHMEEEGLEHFGLSWPGKRDARRLAAMPSKGTLIPQTEVGVNEENTHNIFIEGDNLEVLKLLQKSYVGRVKMIYIDPPYNTGNDFIYRDEFSEPLETYLKRTEQADDNGRLLTSNTRVGGRFHSNWLNMMYPRLLLARQLLRDDGAIFVSIDDNELSNLKAIMDEIFGEENYINIVSIKAKPSAGASGGGEDKRLKKNVELLLIYAKNKNNENMSLRFREVFEEEDLFEHVSSMNEEGKSWKYTSVLTSFGHKEYVSTIKDGSGGDIQIFRHQNYARSSVSSLVKQIVEKEPQTNKTDAEKKVYLEYLSGIFSDTNAQSSIRARVMDELGEEDGLFSIEYFPKSGRQKGKRTTVYYVGKQKRQVIWLSDIARIEDKKVILKGQISNLWDNFNWNNVAKEGGISFPNGKKPISFIQRAIQLATTGEDEEIILDFFAGSGSTAHAVIDTNSKDNGNRQFIIVQLPEVPKGVTEFETISELCKQRVRNTIADYSQYDGIDLGFRCYCLDKSHFLDWSPTNGNELNQLQLQFMQAADPLVKDWKQHDLLVEILLLQGFPLDSNIRTLATFKENVIWEVSHPFCAHHLYICLDLKVTQATAAAISICSEDVVVCLDIALTDEDKIKLSDRCNLKVI